MTDSAEQSHVEPIDTPEEMAAFLIAYIEPASDADHKLVADWLRDWQAAAQAQRPDEGLLREVAGIGLYAYEDPSQFWNDPKRDEMLAKLRALTANEGETDER